MNSTNETDGRSHVAPDGPLSRTAPCRGPFTKTAVVAMTGGILCTAFALRSLVQQHWLVWYELFIALIGGYVCVVAACICGIRSRFSLNRCFVTSLFGLLIASFGLYFFHFAYTRDLFFRLSESEIRSYDVILLCDVDRRNELPQYRVAKVLRNRRQIPFEPREVVPGFDEVMDKFLSQPGTGNQIIFFADVEDQKYVAIGAWQQVYDGRIAGFQDTRLSHLSDLQAFREFVSSDNQ